MSGFVFLSLPALRTVKTIHLRHGHPQHDLHCGFHHRDGDQADGSAGSREASFWGLRSPRVLRCVSMTRLLISSLQHYFIDPWNSFDALIVVGSVLDIAVSELSVSLFWLLLLEAGKEKSVQSKSNMTKSRLPGQSSPYYSFIWMNSMPGDKKSLHCEDLKDFLTVSSLQGSVMSTWKAVVGTADQKVSFVKH